MRFPVPDNYHDAAIAHSQYADIISEMEPDDPDWEEACYAAGACSQLVADAARARGDDQLADLLEMSNKGYQILGKQQSTLETFQALARGAAGIGSARNVEELVEAAESFHIQQLEKEEE
jgi:hypothetical protein